jgi:pimeloyl-ACP methyl ester carboxylesterase
MPVPHGAKARPVEPVTLVADPAAVADLRSRLRGTRWPDAPEGSGWSLGTDVGYLRDLVRTWAEDFDWAAQVAALARHPRFRAEVGPDRLGVHLVHVRATPAPDGTPALPLLLCHGWPDSSWRYTKVIDLLTDPGAHGADPADAFDVVVPEMPGFGWSDAPRGAPLDSIAVAGLWAELMTTLGYPRFGAAGGDVGSHVSRYLALDHPERLVGVHRTDAGLPSPSTDLSALTPEERDWFAEVTRWGAVEGAYAAIHRTRPQTAAVGLTDSPAGLAAWIVEKLRAWSDCGPDGDLDAAYSRDEILTLISQYWFTGTMGSSLRMSGATAALDPAQLARRVEVPSGFAIFGGDVVRPPRAWLERMANAVRITEPEHGGHFAAFEQPEVYAAELRAFFRPLRAAASASSAAPASPTAHTSTSQR